MANFQRHHANKSKHKNKKKSQHKDKEDENTRGDHEHMAADQAGLVADHASEEEEETKKTTVVLRCSDGVELEVPKSEARRYGRTIEDKIMDEDVYASTRSSGRSLIRLPVQSDILSMVIRYSDQQASDHAAVEFLGGLGHATLVDLVLGTERLENRGLLGLACRAVADVITSKSPPQIRAMFGIRPPPAAAGSTPQDAVNAITTSHDQEAEERALRALHIVRCQDFAAYDPRRHAYWCTRFHDYNIAFFDLDKESRFGRGPPLHRIRESSIVSNSFNFISLKVCESDVGFPINVFGTVIARDRIDYRCVYLFRREAHDSQVITSLGDTLTLIDPHRGLVAEDIIYFEINLKIKCDGGATKDFSRGLTGFNICRLRNDREIITTILDSWLSMVELKFAHVPRPLEASITISVLKGPCELTRIAAWTSGNTEARIILYGSERAAGTQMIKNVCSVVLARRVVFVPLGEKLVLHLVGEDEDEHLVLTLGHDEYQRVCKMRCSEVQVKVSWTWIPERMIEGWREVVGNVWLLT